MENTKDVFFVSAARTAIGAFGGALKDFTACDLGGNVAQEAFSRAGVDPGQAGQIIFENVIHCEARDMHMSRVAGINAGLAKESAALMLNRLCGFGLQPIVTAANAIQLGDTEVAVGGDVKTMSRAPYAIDMMTGALSDPFGATI